MPECIAMVEKESGLPSMTVSEYNAKVAAGEIEEIRPPEGHR